VVQIYSSKWYFQLTLNILTPFILLGLGFILAMAAKKKNNKENELKA
jgi:ABC-type uncharacterized transport system permease subunit